MKEIGKRERGAHETRALNYPGVSKSATAPAQQLAATLGPLARMAAPSSIPTGKFPYILSIMGMLVFVTSSSADTPTKPLAKSELVGEWAGYEKEYPYFYRLSFRDDGTGSLMVLYPEGRPIIYRIDRWSIQARLLSLEVSPIEDDVEKIRCSVIRFDHLRLEISIRSVENEWVRRALLVNEKHFLKNLTASMPKEPTDPMK